MLRILLLSMSAALLGGMQAAPAKEPAEAAAPGGRPSMTAAFEGFVQELRESAQFIEGHPHYCPNVAGCN